MENDEGRSVFSGKATKVRLFRSPTRAFLSYSVRGKLGKKGLRRGSSKGKTDQKE